MSLLGASHEDDITFSSPGKFGQEMNMRRAGRPGSGQRVEPGGGRHMREGGPGGLGRAGRRMQGLRSFRGLGPRPPHTPPDNAQGWASPALGSMHTCVCVLDTRVVCVPVSRIPGFQVCMCVFTART